MSEWTVGTLKEHIDAIREDDLRARELTERRMDDKFEEHNRFRTQLEQERTTYVTRPELDAMKTAFTEYKETTSRALDVREGQTKGISATGAIALGVLTAAGSVVAIIAVWKGL